MNDWLTDWDARYESAFISQEDLTDLDLELEDMLDRHPGWDGTLQDPPAPAARTLSAGFSAASGRGMGSGVEQWKGLVAEYFPGEIEFALCVIRGESRGDPGANNPTSTAAGLWQFLKSTWNDMVPRSVTGGSYESGAVYDPIAATRAAAWLRTNVGWSQWNAAARC